MAKENHVVRSVGIRKGRSGNMLPNASKYDSATATPFTLETLRSLASVVANIRKRVGDAGTRAVEGTADHARTAGSHSREDPHGAPGPKE